MRNLIKGYPLSLTVVAVVLFLSLFKPPHTGLDTISNLDKLVHVAMYSGVSGLFWLEFLKLYRGRSGVFRRGFVPAVFFPLLLSGGLELAQAYCTTYRGGDWFDFMANAVGVGVGTVVAYLFIRPYYQK
ncbi:MAG: hypothetical protein EOM31_05440 [Bacteroidia bacterium]|nr:hypothetical protein [Bacteroidia bacterium]